MSGKKTHGARGCCAYNCTNSRKNSPNLSFHSFPNKEEELERCKKWVQNLKRKFITPECLMPPPCSRSPSQKISTKNMLLCENHFTASQFMNPAEKGKAIKRKHLRPDAVPTIFDLPKNVRSVSSGEVKRKSPKKRIASADVQLQNTDIMPRPKRQCTSRPASPSRNIWSQGKWTIDEKKALLAAIKINGTDDLEKFRNYLPGRSQSEIRKKLNRYAVWAKTKYGQMRRMRAPIEFWNCQVAFLTENLHELSSLLSRVMSIAANMEPRQPSGKNVPDYSAIYLYISELMRGEQLNNLGQREALVMLSLFQDMAKHLHSLDFGKQKALMLKKFRALSQSVDMSRQTSEGSFSQMMQDLQQDLTEQDLKHLVKQRATCPASGHQMKQRATCPASGHQSQHLMYPTKQEVTSSPPNNGGSCQSEQKGVASGSSSSGSQDASSLNENNTSTQSNLSASSSSLPSTSKQSTETSMSRPSSSRQPSSSATASNPSSASTSAQDEDKLPQHAPLYSLNPLCIPIKYMQPTVRPAAPSTAIKSKDVDIPPDIIEEAFKKGLIKVGDVIKVKVVQQPDGSNKVVLEKDNKLSNEKSGPQHAAKRVSSVTSPPQSTAKRVSNKATPPQSTAKRVSNETTPPQSTAKRVSNKATPPQSTAKRRSNETPSPQSTAKRRSNETPSPQSTAKRVSNKATPPQHTAKRVSNETTPPQSTANSVTIKTSPPSNTGKSVGNKTSPPSKTGKSVTKKTSPPSKTGKSVAKKTSPPSKTGMSVTTSSPSNTEKSVTNKTAAVQNTRERVPKRTLDQ